MKQPPLPLTWQPLVTLEEVRRLRAERHQQLDQTFRAEATPEAITAAFHAAARADAYEAAILADVPSLDTIYRKGSSMSILEGKESQRNVNT